MVQSAIGVQCKENLGKRGQLTCHAFATPAFFVHSKQTLMPRKK